MPRAWTVGVTLMDDKPADPKKGIPWTTPKGLGQSFVKNPQPFMESDSSRVAPTGRVVCACRDPRHTFHQPGECGEEAYTNDGLCRRCFTLEGGSTNTVD